MRPEAEYEEANDRCEATDAGREALEGTDVGGASLFASVKIPQSGAHLKYTWLECQWAYY